MIRQPRTPESIRATDAGVEVALSRHGLPWWWRLLGQLVIWVGLGVALGMGVLGSPWTLAVLVPAILVFLLDRVLGGVDVLVFDDEGLTLNGSRIRATRDVSVVPGARLNDTTEVRLGAQRLRHSTLSADGREWLDGALRAWSEGRAVSPPQDALVERVLEPGQATLVIATPLVPSWRLLAWAMGMATVGGLAGWLVANPFLFIALALVATPTLAWRAAGGAPRLHLRGQALTFVGSGIHEVVPYAEVVDVRCERLALHREVVIERRDGPAVRIPVMGPERGNEVVAAIQRARSAYAEAAVEPHEREGLERLRDLRGRAIETAG